MTEPATEELGVADVSSEPGSERCVELAEDVPVIEEYRADYGHWASKKDGSSELESSL